MMPMAPASMMAIQSKPKIGFSIDSIVGSKPQSPPYFSPNSEGSERPSSPLSDCSYPSDFNNGHYRSPKVAVSPNDVQHQLRLKSNYSPKHLSHRNGRLSPTSPPPSTKSRPVHLSSSDHNNVRSSTPLQTRLSPDPPGNQRPQSRSPSPIQRMENKGPIMVPGIPAGVGGVVRPFPVPPQHGMGEMKPLPPYMNPQEMLSAAHNQHMIAAQFQAAAAFAQAHAGQGFGHGGMPPHPGHMHNPNMARDSYPLYPWLLSRHGRLFPHRFPGNFLLQPFRKPKRVRTAFSPGQLLKLEHAFEGNHYVVGAERKQLAQNLSLSETQVKVWFQNRRTKHKRMQQEEDSKTGGGGNNNGSKSPSNHSYDDDELIDMDMDDEGLSGDENDM